MQNTQESPQNTQPSRQKPGRKPHADGGYVIVPLNIREKWRWRIDSAAAVEGVSVLSDPRASEPLLSAPQRINPAALPGPRGRTVSALITRARPKQSRS